MKRLSIDGIPQKDLDESLNRVEELRIWAEKENIDRWAFRAALLKALYNNADEYFERENGTYREIAAFDNGVATVMDSLKNKE